MVRQWAHLLEERPGKCEEEFCLLVGRQRRNMPAHLGVTDREAVVRKHDHMTAAIFENGNNQFQQLCTNINYLKHEKELSPAHNLMQNFLTVRLQNFHHVLDWLTVQLLVDPNNSVLETAPLSELIAQLPQQITLSHAWTGGEMCQLMLVDQFVHGREFAFAVEGRACVGVVTRRQLAVSWHRVKASHYAGREAEIIGAFAIVAE